MALARTSLVLFVAALSAPAAAQPAGGGADPVFTGTVARDERLEGIAGKVTAALGRAFAQAGVSTVGPETDKGSAPTVKVEDLKRLVADAQGRFFDGDFEGAVAQAEEGIRRFELGPAFRSDDEAWSVYAELQMQRVLALGRLDEEKQAQKALRDLASQRPLFVPDPSVIPPKVVSAHTEALDKIKKQKVGPLEVVSRPAGAEVVVDGRKVGVTPVTVTDLLAGTHYLAVSVGDERYEEKIELGKKGKKVEAQLGDPRAAAARQLNQRLRISSGERQVGDEAARLGPTVYTALVESAPGRITLYLGRFENGRLDAVTGTTVADDLSNLDGMAGLLVQAGRVATLDASVDGTPNPELRTRFLGTPAGTTADTTVTDDESEGGAGPLVIIGVGAAVAGVAAIVVVGSAAAVGIYLYSTQPPNPGGTDILIDASRL